VQAASNGKDNDKQGQEERYYETIKWQNSLQNLKGYWSHEKFYRTNSRNKRESYKKLGEFHKESNPPEFA